MITLIGKNLAKKGQVFVFLGPADECKNCRFKSSCISNLELNRKYVITKVLENEQNCPIHSDGKVIPVEVDLAEIELLTNSKNIFEGSIFTFEELDCDEKCEYHDLCFPDGLIKGDKCIVINNGGKHKGKCKKGYNLNKLTLGFVI